MKPPETLGKKLLIGVAVLLVAACGFGTSSQLAQSVVNELDTTLVFGIPSPSPAPVQTALPALQTYQPPPLFFTGNNFAAPTFNNAACPQADSAAVPAAQAGADVTSMPKPGEYHWVNSGMWTYNTIGNTLHLPVPNNSVTVVRDPAVKQDPLSNVPGTAPDFEFTFQTIQQDLSAGAFYVYHWQVKTNAQTGDPEGGLALEQIDVMDLSGKIRSTIFKAQVGLLILPIPVAPGPVGPAGSATSNTPAAGQAGPDQSTDTSGSNNNMTFSGTVGGRERIDACGQWIQAWPVDGTLINGSGTATVHFDIATQYGAIPVAFNYDGTWLGTPYNKVLTRQGQVDPDSIEKRFQG